MSRRSIPDLPFLLPSLIFLAAGTAHADICSDALDAGQKYIDGYEQIRRLTVEEQRGLVKAICGADDEARSSIARDAGERVQSDVRSNHDALNRAREEFKSKLSSALSDEQCKDKKESLVDRGRRVDEIAERIERMTGAIRGGNKPVVNKLRELGPIAHQSYPSARGSCVATEVIAGNYRVDCIKAESDVCWAIEIKPNSSNAVYAGRDQARGARDILNTADGFKDALNRRGELSACQGKKFHARVDLRLSCPEIYDNGEMPSASMDWTTCDSD